MRIMTVVGARPEFIMTAPLSKQFQVRHTEILVHTGQHYNANLSDVFFQELAIPEPKLNLGAGSGSHAEQMANIMLRLEPVILAERPDWMLVYGDTNSTIAGSLTAAKLGIPVAHVEAGLRSFDRTMPEEINRILTDHVSTLFLAPTPAAVDNLKSEGITQGVHLVGDLRVDVLTEAMDTVRAHQDELLKCIERPARPFALATIHRAANTDDVQRLANIVEAFTNLDMPIVLPIHPRLSKMLTQFGLQFGPNVQIIQPVGLLQMLALMSACNVVITDSGGLQKEAYLLCRPAVTVRNSTEWVETVAVGWNRLCEPDPASLQKAVDEARTNTPAAHPDLYGTYSVSQKICTVLEQASI